MDLSNMIAELPASERANAKIAIFTDKNVAKLPVMRTVEESLLREGLNWVLWDKCAVEPTDKSWQVSSSRLSPVQLRGGTTNLAGSDRVDSVRQHHSLPRSRRRLVYGYRQSRQLVQHLQTGRPV
jgi:hypothetical protein